MKAGKLAAALAGFAMVCSVAGARAQDFGAAPANYQTDVKSYFVSRVAEPQGMRMKFSGRPYRVYADLRSIDDAPCWAVDFYASVKIENSGRSTRYQRYTVIFYQGRPVALKTDLPEVSRV